jgi:hypothetical protein
VPNESVWGRESNQNLGVLIGADFVGMTALVPLGSWRFVSTQSIRSLRLGEVVLNPGANLRLGGGGQVLNSKEADSEVLQDLEIAI